MIYDENRMQDLDFEQTVAFDSVKDFEFTRRAAQRFRQVVSLDGLRMKMLTLFFIIYIRDGAGFVRRSFEEIYL